MDPNGKFWKKTLMKQKEVVVDTESSEAEKETSNSPKICCQKFCSNFLSLNPEVQATGTTKLRSRSTIFSIPNKLKTSLHSSYREQLEITILNEEMNEQLCYDKHNVSKKQIQDLFTLLRSFASYVHSLDMRYKVAGRLQTIFREIVPGKFNPLQRKDITILSLHGKIKELLHLCYSNIELPSNYYEGCKEYSKKYKEHSEATLNCYYLLQNERIPDSEIKDLDLEYENVRKEFNKSKIYISSQLSSIIIQQSDVIQKCVKGIIPILKEMMEQDKDIYTILKTLSSGVLAESLEKIKSSKSLHKTSKFSRSDSSIRLRNASRNCCCLDRHGDDC